MTCGYSDRTRAWLSGELAGEDTSEIERHVAGCLECQDQYPAGGGAPTRFHAPLSLRRSVSRALDAETRRPTRRSFWFGALGGSFTTALAAGLALLLFLPPSAATLADAVVDAHTRAVMSGETIMVASSDHHTVKPWFASHIALSPPVANFARQGFPLIGGRTDRVAGHDAAAIAYRHGKHELDLFVWVHNGGKTAQSGMRRGYRIAFWRNGDLDFAAISDVDAVEFAKFVSLARGSPE
jgi:anti-sigma factor RsiW